MTSVKERRAQESDVTQILRCKAGAESSAQEDSVAREEPLEIRVGGKSIAVTMRTPGHDKELAAGFLISEGLVHSPADLLDIADCEGCEIPNMGNILNVFFAPSVPLDMSRLTRHVFASSSCGVCGKASIEAVHQNFAPVDSQLTIGMEKIIRMPAALREAQQTFSKTGGLHASGVFDRDGNLIVLREDVGRHNALDKVIGYGFFENLLPFDSHVLMVSGRTSFEIMQKALAARIPIVCAVSAPSSLAVEFARESGQTLVGFLRGDTMNIYSHPERIVSA
jgi:FdhD protein